MFKNLNRTVILAILLTVGMSSHVFAIDFSQAFDQLKSTVVSIGSFFDGSAQVRNLYQKSLKLAKDNEVVSTMTSLDQLKRYYNDCHGVRNTDFINVLYHSNASFALTFDAILSTTNVTRPSSEDIDKSYQKFLACKGIKNSSKSDREAISNEVQNIYYDSYINAYTLSTLNQKNFGSDLLRNGTLDDSDFDLLSDIDEIGKLLFDQFQESPDILFYRLPKISGANDASSEASSDTYQVGGGGFSFAQTTVSYSSGISSSLSPAVDEVTSSSQEYLVSSSSPLEDTEIQSLIDTTVSDPATLSSVSGDPLFLGNSCLSGIQTALVPENTALDMDSQAYIDSLVDFIDSPSVTTQVLDALADQFHEDRALPEGGSSSYPGYADMVANSYAEQAFGDALPGTCAYGCKDMPLDKQAQCELDCAKSCIQSCDALTSLSDKAICISDCTCFLIAGPNGAGWTKMEDMYRIKFCKVPVQKQSLSPGKKVYSIQAIFQEISDVLEGLRDSGQMVKYSRTKEFLDGAIKIQFADNFAFKLQVSFKPLFPQRSTTARLLQQEKEMKSLSLGITNMNVASPEADNYNKYLVISDPIKNAAETEPGSSLVELQQNYVNASLAEEASQTTQISDEILDDFLTIYSNQTNVVVMQNMISFLEDNQAFRHNFTSALLDFNALSLSLKRKIEFAD